MSGCGMSATAAPVGRLVDQFEHGLDAPICLTWELTYACNLACVHCLSSSGRRDPRELSTAECKAVIDELQRMQVFYVNIGGGEPTVRTRLLGAPRLRDGARRGREVLHQRLADHARDRRAVWPRTDYVDVQISLDGATRRGQRPRPRAGSYDTALRAMDAPRRRRLRAASRSRSSSRARTSAQLDDVQGDRRRATARSCGSRACGPSGRGADVWDELHPTAPQQRELYDVAARARRGGADRRLVLPPRRLRRVRCRG